MTLLPQKDRLKCFELTYKRSSSQKQLDKLIEEMSELIQDIMKARYVHRTQYTIPMLEEMGHVELCLEMIRTDLPPHLLEKLDQMKDQRIREWYQEELSRYV